MPVSRPESDPKFLYVIVPKLVKHPLGIVVTQVVDAVQSAVTLDEKNLTGTGILGSAVVNDKLTLFIDIYSLFEAADPENYGKTETALAACPASEFCWRKTPPFPNHHDAISEGV